MKKLFVMLLALMIISPVISSAGMVNTAALGIPSSSSINSRFIGEPSAVPMGLSGALE